MSTGKSQNTYLSRECSGRLGKSWRVRKKEPERSSSFSPANLLPLLPQQSSSVSLQWGKVEVYEECPTCAGAQPACYSFTISPGQQMSPGKPDSTDFHVAGGGREKSSGSASVSEKETVVLNVGSPLCKDLESKC